MSYYQEDEMPDVAEAARRSRERALRAWESPTPAAGSARREDTNEPDPDKARAEMVERNRRAWESPTADPARREDADPDPDAARARMVQRNASAWRGEGAAREDSDEPIALDYDIKLSNGRFVYLQRAGESAADCRARGAAGARATRTDLRETTYDDPEVRGATPVEIRLG